jgi:CHAT domain-containing protein
LARAALLSYFVGEQTSWVFALSPDRPEPLAEDTGVPADHLRVCAQRLLIDCNGLDPHRRDGVGPKALEERALQLPPAARRRSRQWPSHAGPDPRRLLEPGYALTYLDELSEKLLPAALRPVLEDCDVLCISPHGPLHSLPLHALRWRDGVYLGERFGVCYVPGAGVLRHCQARNRARTERTSRPRTALVTCVDMLGSQSFDADSDILSALTRSHVLVGSASATKARVVAEVPRNEVIHLTCHGLFASDCGWKHPLQSAILLADGRRSRVEAQRLRDYPEEFRDCLLTASEILGLSLNADIVTLRACSSGRAQVAAGDDLLGMSHAWLYAGTPSLLVSLWNVNTGSSHRLLRVFYQRWLKDGEPKWQALRAAQRALLHDPENLPHGHPYHWAPFVLIGDWI